MNRLIPATAAALLFTSFLALEFGGDPSTTESEPTRTVAEVALDELTGQEDESGAAQLVAAEGESVATR